MNSSFYSLIGQAVKRSKTAPIGSIEEFSRLSSSAENQLKKIYQENPNATKEEVNKKMQERLREILHETAKISDFKSEIIRRNTIQYLNSHWEIVEQEYRKIIAEERKTGKQLKTKDRILYSPNRKQSIRQLLLEVISNVRDIVSGADKDIINELKKRYNGSIEELKKQFYNPKGSREKREIIERTVYFLSPISELEKVKFYLKKFISLEKTDTELKEEYIEAISIIGQILKDLGSIEKYKKQQRGELGRIGLEKLQDEEGINQIFETAQLQKMSLSQLSALYTFWDNRLVKEVIDIYKTYFIMYELNLDDKKKIESGEQANGLSQEKLEALNVKTSLLDIIISEIYFQYRNTNLDGGRISVEKTFQGISDKIGKDYKKYFSGIGALEELENNFDKDVILYLGLENAIKNLYLQKDNGIIGLLDLLYNGEVAENWGIVGENTNSNFVLLAVDIIGLNMPLRLHIKKDLIKEFAINNQESAIIPLYSGKEDFIINGKNIPTHLLMPLTQEQKDAIKQADGNVKENDCRYKFVKHLVYLTDGLRYPEHLQGKRVTKKKGKIKTKYEKIKEYLDLSTGQRYLKAKEGQLIPSDNGDGR